jgi:CRP/FNR family transcriptional regulator, dissimilatory nitrate respiration regulator
MSRMSLIQLPAWPAGKAKQRPPITALVRQYAFRDKNGPLLCVPYHRFTAARALLRTAAPAALEQLAVQAQARHFEPGEMILAEAEASGGLWLIEAGSVKIFKLTPDGREHVLYLLGPGDTFNDVAALDGGHNPANAGATSRVQAWVIPAARLQATVASDHTLALAVIARLARRVRLQVDQIEDLALRSVSGRLARFILEQADNLALAAPAVTRALIAAHLATTPESVSRALRVLEQSGAIRFDRHRILITKPDLLRDLALI